MECKEYRVKNPTHDICYDCFKDKEEHEEDYNPEDHFEENLTSKEIYTTYIMFYSDNQEKIGYTKDLNSRIFELKRQYPNNKLVYFREFIRETEARRYEAWLKELSKRELIMLISAFHDKVKKLDN